MSVPPPSLSAAAEADRLAALKKYAILDTAPEPGYDDITALASFICETPISLVTLVDSDRQWFKSVRGLRAQETPREISFCTHTVTDGRTLIIHDAALDPRFANNPLVLGEPRVRFYAGAPIVEPSGHVLGTLCVVDDKPRTLSERQIAALEVLARQAMTLLELRHTIDTNARASQALQTAEKLAAVGRLASSVAHEINNPLQSMTNLLFMAEAAGEREDQRAYLRQSQEELARVSHIVTQTLRFHRQSDNPTPTQLAEVVESVLMLFRTRLGHAAVDVFVKDTQTKPLVCYSTDLRQVVANLIGNAIDAVSGLGSGTIHIRVNDAVSPVTGEAGVRLTVADNGAGMDAETRSRLFEPFFSTKGARGTGLGLWVSKGILEKHHTAFRVRSSQGVGRHGTAISIFFPHRV